ncbi:MAG TPA: permease prefix domain 1-containing protein [Planctomycetota bacterium]|nr:permease prefix domain 1-containing protein [Planctomycetota bacterium]
MTTDVDVFVAELQALLGKSAAADSVIREARGHLDDKVAALMRDGMTPADASREAVVAFGDAGKFAFAALADGNLDAVLPNFLRWLMLAGTGLVGLGATVWLGALVLTFLFGREGESGLAMAAILAGGAAILLHSLAFGRLLLRRRQHWLLCSGVFLGGLVLLAVSGAAIVGAGLDDAPGGVLAGLLLAAQGGAAVLTVAFPQLVPQKRSSFAHLDGG